MWTNEDFPVLKNEGVHRTHCCLKHGCKYGDDDCPVALGKVKQDHPCEYCDMDKQDFPVLDNEVKIGRYPTAPQLKKLAVALFRNEILTTFYAQKKYKVCRLSERIRELEKLGWKIKRERIETEGGAHVVAYSLPSEKVQP